MCVFPLLLVLVVLHESEDRFALLNIIMSAKFLSIFRNMKNSCLVSLWSSTCHFISYICEGGGRGRDCACVHHGCVRVCVCERGRERETACVHHDCERERERECVCVRERETERERETVHVCIMTVCVCVRERVCVYVRERERERLHVSSVHM